MLVLKRGVEDDVVIDGWIVVKVLQINSKSVRLGIFAPTDVPVLRGEVWEALVDAFPVSFNRNPTGVRGGLAVETDELSPAE